jgi:hypothetical protein
MTIIKIPTDILTLVDQTSDAGLWAELSAGIPSWHPRNETPGAAAAAAPSGGGEAPASGGEGASGGEPSGLYAEILAGMPEELRPYATESLKKWDAQVNPRLQQASEIQQKYAPFEGIEGLTDMDPEELQGLIELRGILADPEQRMQWIQNVNQALEVPTLDSLDEDSWLQLGQANGWFDDDGEGGEAGGVPAGLTAEDVQRIVQEAISPVTEQMTVREQQERQAAETYRYAEKFSGDMAQVMEQLGEMDPEKTEMTQKAIVKLAHAYVGDDDAIIKAFADYQQITGVTDGDRMERRLGQPTTTTLSGGRPSTEPAKMSWNGGGADPRAAALARMRQ